LTAVISAGLTAAASHYTPEGSVNYSLAQNAEASVKCQQRLANGNSQR